MTNDTPWIKSPPTTPLPRPTRGQHRHAWGPRVGRERMTALGIAHEWPELMQVCVICGKPKDDAASKRGRTSLRAGKDAERLVANDAGPEWKRVGQFGSPVDVEAPWAVGQVKAGSRYSMVDERDLEAMTAYSAGRTRLLFKVKRPGPGHQRKVQITMRLSQFMEEHGDVLVVLDMPDWKELHG